jgi:hypothetical protein
VNAIDKQHRRLDSEAQRDAEVRSWIKHVFIPAMVDEWLSEHHRTDSVAHALPAVAQFERNSHPSLGEIQ